MSNLKLERARFCAQVERCCARMNNGLAVVALVLAAATLSLSLLRVSEEISRDEQLGKLPFIEMSADATGADIASE